MIPESLDGFRVLRGDLVDGPQPALENLGHRDAVEPWTAWAHEGHRAPYFVRVLDAYEGWTLPLEEIRRLSRIGELWVDAKPESHEDLLDLTFSGASRVVLWQHLVSGEDLDDWLAETEQVGLVGVDLAEPGADLEAAITLVQEWQLGLIIKGDVAPGVLPEGEEAIDAYRLTNGEGAWSEHLQRLSMRPRDEEELEAENAGDPDAPVEVEDLSASQRVVF
ncbi:MAG: hypothetical protein ACPGQL_11370 [Thermoplasmatota archaeon]